MMTKTKKRVPILIAMILNIFGTTFGVAAEAQLSRGKWDKNLYTNEFADLQFQLPEGWEIVPDADLEGMNTTPFSFYFNDDGTLMKDAELPYVIEMAAQSSDMLATINLSVEDFRLTTREDDRTVEKYLDAMHAALVNMKSVNCAYDDVTETKLAGQEYLMQETTCEYNQTKTATKQFYRQIGNYLVSVSIGAETPEKIDALLKNFEEIPVK